MALEESFVEELKTQYLKSSTDQRVEGVFEKIIERLTEEADEGDRWLAVATTKPRSKSVMGQQWDLYVLESLASITKRENMLDTSGNPRVQRVYRNSGTMRNIDLCDYKGRQRVRVFFDSAGQATEMVFTSSKGVETIYNKTSFDPEHTGGNLGSNSLGERYDKARRSTIVSLEDGSPHQRSLSETAVRNLCAEAFPQLEEILERERVENRQLIPAAEELLEMSLEQTLEHIDKCYKRREESAAADGAAVQDAGEA